MQSQSLIVYPPYYVYPVVGPVIVIVGPHLPPGQVKKLF